MNLTAPFTFGGTYVVDRNGEIACSTATEADAKRIAADMNLADSVAAEPNIEVTLALHRRDGGESVRAAMEFCAAVLPDELHAAVAGGRDAATLLGLLPLAPVSDFMQRVRHGSPS